MATNMSKKRKFVADGVFYAELNEVRTGLFSSLSLHSATEVVRDGVL